MIKAINRSIAARHEEDEKGFTLIELLVVILIIGVLAAIAIPAFLNQREGAWVSQVKSDIGNAAIAAESFAVDNNGKYATTGTPAVSIAGNAATSLADYGYNQTPDVTVTVAIVPAAGAVPEHFTLTGSHSSITTKYWLYDSAAGTTEEKTGTP